jgi:Flp pilus assembly protein TadG
MMMASALRRFGRHFRTNQKGVAAIEFALIAPVMIALYVGLIEFSNALTLDRKLTHTASALADLVAQDNGITDAEMNDILAASAAIVAPYSPNPLRLVVSSVVADSDNNTTVAWSDAKNTSPRGEGSNITLPEGLTEPGSSVILAEVSYTYTSPFTQFLSGGIELKDRFYLRPRRVLQVSRS